MSSRTLVLGVGNPLVGDDGFGIAALESLRARWQTPDDVRLADGGTWGLNLLPLIEDTGALIILDAIDAGAPPGALVRLEHGELPAYVGLKLSPHQVDLREVFALCALRGTMPPRAVAIGVQPVSVAWGVGLSREAERAVAATVWRAVSQLRAWGHRCVARPAAVHA